MSAREELIMKYAADIKEKCGMTADMDLLTKVTIGCGPSIYNSDASTIAASQPKEVETVKKNFLMKKLGLTEADKLDEGIEAVMEKYGKSNRTKHRAVVYYLLTVHFKKESAYN